MEIDDHKETYEGFIKVSVKFTAGVVILMLLLAAFVA
jgi:Bacterial aa3 type cytochrome c oxidase subunit IV